MRANCNRWIQHALSLHDQVAVSMTNNKVVSTNSGSEKELKNHRLTESTTHVENKRFKHRSDLSEYSGEVLKLAIV